MRSRGSEEVTESQKDFATYAFTGLEPKNTAEVLLCSQMVATYEAGMALLAGSKGATDFQNMTEKGNLAVKLLSIYERQFATLERARRPAQTVTVVHEHRHVHVNAPGPTGEATIIQGQPYGTNDTRAIALAQSPALLSQATPEVAPVPSPCDVQRPLPAPRRVIHRRPKR